jgi:hypothetical protein
LHTIAATPSLGGRRTVRSLATAPTTTTCGAEGRRARSWRRARPAAAAMLNSTMATCGEEAAAKERPAAASPASPTRCGGCTSVREAAACGRGLPDRKST